MTTHKHTGLYTHTYARHTKAPLTHPSKHARARQQVRGRVTYTAVRGPHAGCSALLLWRGISAQMRTHTHTQLFSISSGLALCCCLVFTPEVPRKLHPSAVKPTAGPPEGLPPQVGMKSCPLPTSRWQHQAAPQPPRRPRAEVGARSAALTLSRKARPEPQGLQGVVSPVLLCP